MPTVADMAQLGAELLSAHQARQADIESIQAEVGELMAEVGELMAEFAGLDRQRQAAIQAHKMQTARIMAELHRRMTREFQRLDAARHSEVQAHRARTCQFMGRLHQDTMARQAEARGVMAGVNQFMRHLHRGTKDRKRDNAHRKAAAVQMMRTLQRLDVTRRAHVAADKAETRRQLAGYAADTTGARAEWQRQQAAIASARGAVAAPPPVVEVALEAPSPPEAAVEEEWSTPPERAEVQVGLSQRVLAYLVEHPGVRLPVIEEGLGISRIEAGRAVRELMDQGRVRRDDETREYYVT